MMFRQILVAQEDLHWQLILWRKDEEDPLNTFTLNTVTYGTTSGASGAVVVWHERSRCRYTSEICRSFLKQKIIKQFRFHQQLHRN